MARGNGRAAMPPGELAARFHALFAGAARSHGTYTTTDAGAAGPKLEIRRTARTLREPVTPELWAEHLAGRRPLGVVPIREDDHCLWAAVDVDVYDGIDLGAMTRDCAQRGLPVVVCRSKSGGAHVFVFLSEPVEARLVVPRMRELAALLGHGQAEIFPKQETVLAERGDLGSWLNMPYFGGDRTDRYAVRPDGRGLSMEAFLTLAEGGRLGRRALLSLELRPSVAEFADGPPCLESLAASGIETPGRNEALLALGVFCKRKWPDDWERHLSDMNARHMRPPLGVDEVNSVVRGLRRKDYNYPCRKHPMCDRCNVVLCQSRPHGVGMSGEVGLLGSISYLDTDPPIYFVVLKTGVTVRVSTEQLFNPRDFQLAVGRELHIAVPEYKRTDWVAALRPLLESAVPIEVPAESGTRGKFGELLEGFLTQRHVARTRDGLALRQPWHDEENARVYFRLRDLEEALERARFGPPERGMTMRGWVTAHLRDLGASPRQLQIAGRNYAVWCLDARRFVWGSAPLDLPPADESPL